MLDSECMMLDDQGVSDEWIVRVQGTEYGPANIETLREWKAEGRLLPVNEARQADVDLWTTAAEIPGLFSVPPVLPISEPLPPQTPIPVARRTFAEILVETVQIYRKGFFQFLGLTLLVLLPSICSQLTTAFVQPPQGSNIDPRSVLTAGVAFLTFILSIVMWPVYIAGIQILTAEIAQRNRPSLIAMLNEAVRFWPRVAALCIFVYGVFFLLMVFGLAIAAMALAGGSSVLLVLIAMGLLILQVWMFGRFFVNVLGSSLPFSRRRDLSIHCVKVAIWRAADGIFRGFNAHCGAAHSSPRSGLPLCWRSRSVRSGERCSSTLINC